MADSRRLFRYSTAALALMVGVAFIVLAIVYWALPADSLPSWLPGHKPHSHPRHGHHHKRHGLTAFVLGIASLSVAWIAVRERARRRRDRPVP
jgi:hypothetical protein